MATPLSLLPQLLLALLASCLCSPPTPVSAALVCTDVEPLTGGANSTIHVAVLVWLIGQPHGLFRGQLTDTPATSVPGFGQILSQPYMLGQGARTRGGRGAAQYGTAKRGGQQSRGFVL